MLIRVEQVRLPLGAAEEELPHLACARIGVKSSLLRAWRIVRRSLDARHPHDIHFVYHVDLDLPDEAGGRLRLRGARVLEAEKDAREEVQPGSRPLPGPVVVVGAGPAGFFLALALAAAIALPLVGCGKKQIENPYEPATLAQAVSGESQNKLFKFELDKPEILAVEGKLALLHE